MATDTFGRRLYALMINRGLTQSALAKLSGIPRDDISMYVRELAPPTHAHLVKIANTLGVSPLELTAGDKCRPS